MASKSVTQIGALVSLDEGDRQLRVAQGEH